LSIAHIRGWLAVFVLYSTLWAATAAFNTAQFVRSASAVDGLQGQLSTLFLAALLYIGLVAAYLYGVWLILRRAHSARRYWIITLSAKLPAGIFIGFAIFTVLAADARQAGQLPPSLDEFQVGELRRLFVVVVWLIYWVRSRRVKETFARMPAAPLPTA